jgi:hypothetical protein
MYRPTIADGWKTTRGEHGSVPWENLPPESIDLVIPDSLDPLVLQFDHRDSLLKSVCYYPNGDRILTASTDRLITTFYDNEDREFATFIPTGPATLNVEGCACPVNTWLCPGAGGYDPVFPTSEFPHLTGDRQHQGVSSSSEYVHLEIRKSVLCGKYHYFWAQQLWPDQLSVA